MTPNAYSRLWFELFMPLQTEESTQKDAAFLARQLPLPRYRRILDLCCGHGRHALRLAERGYAVTGLDRDETAIAEARRLALASGSAVQYVVGDMRELDTLPESFDGIVNMWQSFSYFDEATNAELLRNIHAKLTPGGRFIVDMYNRAYFERNQGDKVQVINGITVESQGYMRGNRWHSVLTYRNDQGACGGDHMEWQVFTPDEFRALALASGFTPIHACAWSDEAIPPSAGTARMQIVLQKS